MQLLITLRLTTTHAQAPGHRPSVQLHPEIPIPSLMALIARYHRENQTTPPPLLTVSGRHLAFLYHLVSVLVAAPHCYAVVVIDADHRFDVTRLVSAPSRPARPQDPATALPATEDDLRHLYVYRPAPSSQFRGFRAGNEDPALPNRGSDQARSCVAAAREHMLYGAHASRDRRWWGTIVVGGGGGDVNTGWKGWMEAQRREVPGFAAGLSIEEALRDRDRRHERVRERGWEGRTRFGTYVWGEGRG